MRGVHRKVEEPPRWTPTLTPVQRKLQRRLGLVICAQAVHYLAGGGVFLLDPPLWVWWVFGAIGAAVFVWGLLTVRALTQTGPPFDQERWWWPWRFPRT